MKYVGFGLVILGILGGILYMLQSQLFTEYFSTATRSTLPTDVTQGGAPDQDIAILAKNLFVPWSIAFLPDGTMLTSERDGSLVHIHNNEMQRIVVDGVHERGEGGLLGIVLHPSFETNHWIYLYMTHAEGDSTKNRVVRYVYENNTLGNQKTIIEGIPGAAYHDGGRMAFGPDDYLYITTGDAGVEESAQDKESLSGKILRLTEEGDVPADNPFGNAVYSYGHRNPQGLAWDEQGRLWSTEHGRSGVQSGLDELNLIEKGGNYGWPLIEGGEERDGMITPVLHSGADTTWAPASLAYHEGKLFWGGLRGESLYEVTISGESVENLKAHFRGEYGRIRAVAVGPLDRLYFSTSNMDGRGTPGVESDVIVLVPFSAF
jgi:glucose/arabinose dehydrogenase